MKIRRCTACMLVAATLSLSARFSASASTVLDGATLDHDLTVQTAYIENGLTLLNGATLTTTGTGGGSDMIFHGTQTVTGNGTLALDQENLSITSDPNSSPAILTIDTGITIAAISTFSNGIESQYSTTGNLVNNGTILADNASISIGPFNWTNNGTVKTLNGGGFDFGSFTNSATGVIDASNGGFEILNSFYKTAHFVNNGLIRIHNGSIGLGGYYTADQLGNTDFYNVTFDGTSQPGPFTLDYTGHTLRLDATTGSLTFLGTSTLVGATLVTRDGSQLILTGLKDSAGNVDTASYCTFDNVTLDGTAQSTSPYHRQMISGNLTLLPGSQLSLVASLSFLDPSSTLAGTGDVTAGSISAQSLTIDPGVTIHSGAAAFTFSGNITNNGTLSLDRTTGSYLLSGSSWHNNGTIHLTAGALSISPTTSFSNTGTLFVDGPTASFSFAGANDGIIHLSNNSSFTVSSAGLTNTGSILADTGSHLTLAGLITGTGSITVNSSTLALATTITPSQLTLITPSHATYSIIGNGILDLGGATLTNSPDISWQMINGKITNGTLATPLAISGVIGILDKLSLAADVSISGTPVTVTNYLSLSNSTIHLTGSSGSLKFSGTQSLTGAGQILFDDPAYPTSIVPSSSGTLTIGHSILVATGLGSGTVGNSTLNLVNQGTLSAQTPATTLTVTGSNWSNLGTLQSKNGATLQLAGTFTTASLGILLTTPSSPALIIGTLDNASANLSLTSTSAVSLGPAGTIKNGSISSPDNTPLTVYPAAPSTLNTVDINVPILLLPGSGLNILSSTNQAPVTGSSASLTLSGTWSNPGSISLSAGSSLTLAASSTLPSDFGSISLANSNLNVNVPLTTAQLNTISRTSSPAIFSTKLTNTGDTLNLSDATGNLMLTNAGSITGGTVVTTGSAQLQISTLNNSSATLDGITLQGSLTLLNGSNVNVSAAGLSPVNAHISISSGNLNTELPTNLNFAGSQSLTGTADISFDIGTLSPYLFLTSGLNAISLTLGPGITVHTGSASGRLAVSSSSGTLTNNGLVSAQTSGSSLTLTGHAIINNATFQAVNSSTLTVASNVTNTGTITVSDASLLRIAGAFTNTGTLNLVSGTVLFDYTGSTIADSIRSQLQTGQSAGSWTGAGITSSSASADPQHTTAIAYAESSVLFNLTPSGHTTLAGQYIDATTLILKNTLYGDANLDGTINSDDYTLLDRSYAKHLSDPHWTDGDFNYDGTVDQSDYLLIDRSLYQAQGFDSTELAEVSPGFLAMRESQFGATYVQQLLTSLPEPTPLAACGLALLLPRRRSQLNR